MPQCWRGRPVGGTGHGHACDAGLGAPMAVDHAGGGAPAALSSAPQSFSARSSPVLAGGSLTDMAGSACARLLGRSPARFHIGATILMGARWLRLLPTAARAVDSCFGTDLCTIRPTALVAPLWSIVLGRTWDAWIVNHGEGGEDAAGPPVTGYIGPCVMYSEFKTGLHPRSCHRLLIAPHRNLSADHERGMAHYLLC